MFRTVAASYVWNYIRGYAYKDMIKELLGSFKNELVTMIEITQPQASENKHIIWIKDPNLT